MDRLVLLLLLVAVGVTLVQGSNQAAEHLKKFLTEYRKSRQPARNPLFRSLEAAKRRAMRGMKLKRGESDSFCSGTDPCSGHGECLMDFFCFCEDGYGGERCEKLGCSLAPCLTTYDDSLKKDVDQAKCNAEADTLVTCLEGAEKDSASICDCDEFAIERAALVQYNKDMFVNQNCDNDDYTCNDPKVTECEGLAENAFIALMIYASDTTTVDKALEDFKTCLTELRATDSNSAGCSHNYWFFDSSPEHVVAIIQLIFCPAFMELEDCEKEDKVCDANGNVVEAELIKTMQCFVDAAEKAAAENAQAACKSVKHYADNFHAELKGMIQHDCQKAKKVADFKTASGCSADSGSEEEEEEEEEEEKEENKVEDDYKRSLNALSAKIKNVKRKQAAASRRDQINTLAKLLRKALGQK